MLGGHSDNPTFQIIPVMGQSNAVLISPFLGSAFGNHSTLEFVPTAVGGTSIKSWTPQGINYKNAIAKIKSVKDRRGDPIKYVLFWQGEYEAEGAEGFNDTEAKEWGNEFISMCEALKSDLQSPHLKVIYVRLNPVPGSVNEKWLSIVYEQQTNAQAADRIMLSLDDIAHGNDVHYDAASYPKIAKRMADLFYGN